MEKFGEKKRANTLLLLGVVAGNVERVKNALEMGADIEKRGDLGRTPLMHAVYNGKIGVAKLLLERGAEIEARDDLGYTALKIAIILSDTKMAKMLYENGADLNSKDNEGNALELGSSKGQMELINYWKTTKRQVAKLSTKSKIDEIIEGLESDLKR